MSEVRPHTTRKRARRGHEREVESMPSQSPAPEEPVDEFEVMPEDFEPRPAKRLHPVLRVAIEHPGRWVRTQITQNLNYWRTTHGERFEFVKTDEGVVFVRTREEEASDV